MLMSYLGSIGTVMSGSGFSDALDICYGPNAVVHMISGKAFSRALRGYLLVDAAVTARFMSLVTSGCACTADVEDGSVTQHTDVVSVDELMSAFSSVWSNGCDSEGMAEADEALVALSTRLAEVKNKLLCKSRTAKLQCLYEMDTVKMFIRAERCGDWNLHLIAVTRMLNLFAAAVHFQYAKCARLYLQSMHQNQLPETHPWLHAQFEEHGFHAVRRSDRCWSGLWTDLVIEQE